MQECSLYGQIIEWNHSLVTNIKHNTGKLKAIAMAEEISMFLFEGPTSYAPVIEAAIDIVEQSHGQFHVLVIVADGQVNNINCVCKHVILFPSLFDVVQILKVTTSGDDGELSPQEARTIKAIADAR